jgi:tetratricopeptide (TPR) repeat protein
MRRILLFLAILATVGIAGGLIVWRQWPNRYLQAGETALQERRYDEAREHLAAYLSHRPDDPRARLLAARAARNLTEFYEAFEHLRRAKSAGGDAESIDVETELIAIKRGKEPGPQLRERAEQNDDLALVILEVLIQHDIDTYRLRQALHGLTRYLERRPHDLHALLARGYVWERFLYFNDALDDYRHAVERHPHSDRARLKLAETALIAGTPQEALEQYQWLAREHADKPEVMLGLARCHRLLGELEEADRLLSGLLQTSPESGQVLWEKGQLELERSRPAKAEPWLRKAVAANPYDRRIAYSLNRCLLSLGRSEEAEKVNARIAALDADVRRLDEVRQAVMERPEDAALRREGGLIFLRNGEQEEGIRWLQHALRLNPGDQEARNALDDLQEAE